MNEVSILTNQVKPNKGEICTKISKWTRQYPVLAHQLRNPGIALFSNLSEAVSFCQVFDKVEVDQFCVKLPVMPKYKPMAEKGMIKRPLSLDEAREQMILIGAS